MTLVPAARPHLTREALIEHVAKLGLVPAEDPIFVVGIRGYYRDTMGAVGRNDRGIFDDAIFLVAPNTYMACNGNTDPSRVRKGSGKGAAKGMAVLNPGLWRVHRAGMHRGKYMALTQRAGPVTVTRDGNPPYVDTGMFGINIHHGGAGTSSLGCQTIPLPQWAAFWAAIERELKQLRGAAWKSHTVPYALIDGPVI